MQSPFSFRRFAPAFDYLGSPFSAFFRPLLLGFRSTLSRFPTSFFRSTFTFFRQLLSRFWLLSVLFFFSALFPVLLTAAPRCSSVSFVPFVFPLPSRLISHAFLPVLLTQLSCIVSFRPSQFRSRSRSTGAHLTLCFSASSQMFAHAFRPLSLSSGLELNYSAAVSSFPFFHRSRLTVGFFGFSGPLSLPRPSPYSQPGFPCFLSGSKYSAFCLFPFVLPCFAPTAVPQVLPFWFSPLGSTLGFRFLSVSSALASHYSAYRVFLSCFPTRHTAGFWVRPFHLAVPRLFFRVRCLVSHAFSSVLSTRLSVCFLSSFPASLPQLFHRCSPFSVFRLPLGVLPCVSPFFHPVHV